MTISCFFAPYKNSQEKGLKGRNTLPTLTKQWLFSQTDLLPLHKKSLSLSPLFFLRLRTKLHVISSIRTKRVSVTLKTFGTYLAEPTKGYFSCNWLMSNSNKSSINGKKWCKSSAVTILFIFFSYPLMNRGFFSQEGVLWDLHILIEIGSGIEKELYCHLLSIINYVSLPNYKA